MLGSSPIWQQSPKHPGPRVCMIANSLVPTPSLPSGPHGTWQVANMTVTQPER